MGGGGGGGGILRTQARSRCSSFIMNKGTVTSEMAVKLKGNVCVGHVFFLTYASDL